jgi:sugar (pentulose or hexulose) kinase
MSVSEFIVLAVGPDGKPLTNSLIWSDIRSAEIAQSISLRPEAPVTDGELLNGGK